MDTTASPTVTASSTSGAMATGMTYTFNTAIRKLAISLILSSVSTIFVKINSNTCSATNWDFIVTANTPYLSKDRHINFTRVCLYCADALVNGTDYVVKGII